jgi:hypothetical protein
LSGPQNGSTVTLDAYFPCEAPVAFRLAQGSVSASGASCAKTGPQSYRVTATLTADGPGFGYIQVGRAVGSPSNVFFFDSRTIVPFDQSPITWTASGDINFGGPLQQPVQSFIVGQVFDRPPWQPGFRLLAQGVSGGASCF